MKNITITWDAQDADNKGWAYQVEGCESGAINGHAAQALNRIRDDLEAEDGDRDAVLAAVGATVGDQVTFHPDEVTTIDLSSLYEL